MTRLDGKVALVTGASGAIGRAMSPFNRIGAPEDIADVVAFLVSDQARWLTGQDIVAAGGAVS